MFFMYKDGDNNHWRYVDGNHSISVITTGIGSWKKMFGEKDHSSSSCESDKRFERLLKIVKIIL